MTGPALTAERKSELFTLFNQAVQLHLAGNVALAAQVYERLLHDLPHHADILDLYGTALFQLGSPAAGRPYVATSLARRPLWSATWNHLGAIDRGLQNDPAAAIAFQRAILVDPSSAEPHVNLAAIFGDRDQAQRGLALNRRALLAAPGSPDAGLRQGVLLRRAGRPQDALPHLKAAWGRQPGNLEVALNLARANVDLGHLQKARLVVMAAIALTPGAHELYGSLATTHDPRWSTPRDVAWARYATVLRPMDPRSWVNLCAESFRDGRIDEAYGASRRTLVLDPASDMGLRNLAAAAVNRTELDYCRTVSRRVLLLNPDNPEAMYSLAEVEFRVGDVAAAWRLHESRLRRDMHRPRLNLPEPWAGPGTETGALLIASEQGVGDEVTFLSCLPEFMDRIDVPVVIEVDKRLVGLIARSFPTATVVPRQFAPGDGLGQFFDYAELIRDLGIRHAVSSGSLPMMLGRNRDQPLDRVGYLKPDPIRVAHWHDWLEERGAGIKVGIVWRTAQLTRFRARIHCTIDDLVPVFSTPGCTFINLMVGDTAAEVARVQAMTGASLVTPPELDIWDDLDGLSALLAALDVVVAARTANFAFAAAVGVPTIRLAQSFMHISDGREFFFPNAFPMFDRREAFDGPEAGCRAAAKLSDIIGSRPRGT